MSPISVVVADDIVNTREDVKRLLFFEEDIKVVGEAGDGEEAIRVVEELKPDVVLMDINMPGLDGISATERITERVPQTAVVIISIQGEHEYLRKAMAAGASDYLVKPFTSQELAETIRRVHEKAKKRQDILTRLQKEPEELLPGRVVVFFGSKGGVGRSTLACNLAVAMAQELKQRVIVADLDIAAGDVAALFNVGLPGSIAELVREPVLNEEVIKTYIVTHVTGVKVLGAIPSREEDFATVATGLGAVIEALKQEADWVLVDTPPGLNAAVARVLDLADEIIVVGQPDVVALRRLKADVEFLTMHQLGDKIRVVLNNALFEGGLRLVDVERSLGLQEVACVTADPKTVLAAANKGMPFVALNKTSRVAQDVIRLAEKFVAKEPAARGEKRSLFGKLLTL